jgi:hypothetical protein
MFSPLLLSIDSLLAAFALSGVRYEPYGRTKMVLMFGICDGLASLIRGAVDLRTGELSWMDSPQFHWVVVFYTIVICFTWVFVAARHFSSRLCWTVPVALALDNLVCTTPSAVSVGSVASAAFASVLMSLFGFLLGNVIADRRLTVSRQLARGITS